MAYERHGEAYAVLLVDQGGRRKVVLSELRPLPATALLFPACSIQVGHNSADALRTLFGLCLSQVWPKDFNLRIHRNS